MRANDFVTEDNRLHLKDFVVTVSPHALNQCYNRGVDSKQVDIILKNISQVKNNIMSLEPGSAFILHNGKGTGLGVRKGTNNNLTLATVYNTGTGFSKGKHPTFMVNANSTQQQEPQ